MDSSGIGVIIAGVLLIVTGGILIQLGAIVSPIFYDFSVPFILVGMLAIPAGAVQLNGPSDEERARGLN